MSKPSTIKMLIIAEATRIIDLLDTIPEEHLKYTYGSDREKSELKKKMAELRRDTVTMEKLLYTYVSEVNK